MQLREEINKSVTCYVIHEDRLGEMDIIVIESRIIKNWIIDVDLYFRR